MSQAFTYRAGAGGVRRMMWALGWSPFMKDPGYVGAVVVLLAVAIASVALRLADSDVSSASREGTSLPSATVATRMTVTPAPTATATAGPSFGDVLSDTRRLIDLANWKDALDAQRARSGSYPSTGGAFVVICARATDAVCLLRSLDSELQAGDGLEPYWYRSDGRSYTLATAVAAGPAAETCPADLPPALKGGHVACLSSGGRP